MYMSGFHTGFFVGGGGGGGLFRNSEIDIKHTCTFLEGMGACPRKFLTNHCPEIKSGGFWQLADCHFQAITS